jgi:Tfp pilus assembly protein PilF/predicted Ser/Thr protein kinase
MERKQLGGYELRDILGEGGMGTVYRALDPTLDRRAAIKVIRAQMLSDEGKQRFLREARACSKINHPNIITVYAAGEEDGMPYMAMEFIDGRTLREVVKEGPIDWRTAVRWTVNLLDALSRLHDEGIVHRDLKPENIMVTSDRVIKLMDFGLAHLSTQTAITEEGTTLGTVPYMSPEQVMGKKADTRSDIFSIATILHEMLTGDHPFRGEHPMAVMYSIKNETPKPIKLQSQDYPLGLQAVLDRAFTKELDKRYQTAQEFRDDLNTLLPEVSGIVKVEQVSSKRSVVIGVGVAALILALGFTGWKVVSGRRAESNRNAAINHNQQGDLYFDKGDKVNAEMEYRQALMADPNYPIARNNLGTLALDRGEVAEADSLFREAARLNPNYPEPRFSLGVIAEAKGDTKTAEARYRDAIAADSTYLGAYSNLGAMLLDEGRLDDARAILDKGLTIEPRNANEAHAQAYVLKNRGKVALADGKTAEAEAFFERAAQTIPDDAELQGLLESL